MEKSDRQSSSPEQAAGQRELQRAQRPAPGKVTRTSKLSPGRGPAVQRKEAAAGGAPAPARSLWDRTTDPWMDAAHRGSTALGSAGSAPVQRKAASVVQFDLRDTAREQHEARGVDTPEGGSGGQHGSFQDFAEDDPGPASAREVRRRPVAGGAGGASSTRYGARSSAKRLSPSSYSRSSQGEYVRTSMRSGKNVMMRS